MELTFSAVVGYLLGIMIVLIVARIFLKPIKFLLKILLNSVFGAGLLYIINLIGSFVGIHIGLNAVTAVAVGLLGIPAVILLLILQIFY